MFIFLGTEWVAMIEGSRDTEPSCFQSYIKDFDNIPGVYFFINLIHHGMQPLIKTFYIVVYD